MSDDLFWRGSPITPAPRVEKRAQRIQDPVERLRFLRVEMAARPPQTTRRRRWPVRVGGIALFAIIALAPGPISSRTADVSVRERRLVIAAPHPANEPAIPARVWRVEHSETSDLYSNGLRVDLTFAVANRLRAHYPIYPLSGGTSATKAGNAPVGIVFHTTESHLVPFEEDENRRLKQLGRNLLEVIRRGRSYHYVIDRFGRVFGVVEESDAANHAGFSIWADAAGIYVNLNDSFLGVSFEGQTGAVDEFTPAQLSSAKVLTEMLRSRHGIAAENCVTHAQVSVNPQNMKIGSHVDWAGKFNFAAVGLPDNYAIPLPSLYAFGFDYDGVFLQAIGERWKGLDLAESQLDRRAAAENLPVARFRAILRRRYHDIAAALKEQNEGGS